MGNSAEVVKSAKNLLFPQHQPPSQLRVLEKRNLLFKAPLLQFYRLVPHETPTPGSLSEDSLLLPGRHQFELVGDVGFRDLNPTPSFSRTHASHEFVRRGFERLSSRRLKPRVFSARLYKASPFFPSIPSRFASSGSSRRACAPPSGNGLIAKLPPWASAIE